MSENKGILIPCVVNKFTTLQDNTVRITIDTNELAPSDLSSLFALRNQFVTAYLKPNGVPQEIKDEIDKTDVSIDETGKSPSKRLRNVLFRYWEQDNKGYKDFELYYIFMMGQIIEAYKNKLD